ncbi:hypothetical protein [Microtetraspora glauca]|uniref:Uncharacterized protein n=1 Tax=Microtetraspora glauca TaxID=1996 RepID=A0ABV3GSB2_MICGL
MNLTGRGAASAILTGALVALASGCTVNTNDTSTKKSDQSPQHLVELYGIALSIIHPDYYVGLDGAPVRDIQTNKTEIPIAIEAIPQTGFDSGGVDTREVAIVRTNTEGDLVFPRLKGNDATSTLKRYLAGQGRTEKSKRQVAQVLEGLDDEHFAVTVIIELRHPMSDEELEKASLDGAQKVLFPMTQSGLPIAWTDSNCTYSSLDCDGPSPVKHFRTWLAQLTKSDRDLLIKKRVYPDQLLRLTEGGRVAGLMYDLTLPTGMLSVVNNPNVRAAYLAGVQLRKPIP